MIELKRIQQRLISAWVTLSSRDIVAIPLTGQEDALVCRRFCDSFTV